MALTPEEQRELEELESLEPVEVEGEGLSEEEALELESLQSMEKPEEVSQLESVARGAAQGLTLGFADEITGALKAAVDVATTDSTVSEAAALYTKHRDESRAAYKEAELMNPKSYLAGEVTGALGSAVGGVGLAGKVGALTLRNVLSANTIKAAVGLGAVEGLGRAEEVTDVGSIATGAALGGAGGVAGRVLGTGFRAIAAKSAAKKAEKLAAKKAGAVLDAIGVRTGKKVQKFEKNVLLKRGVTEEQFMDDLDKAVDWKENMTPIELRDKLGAEKVRIWKEEVDPILNSVDEAIPEGAINTQRLMSSIQDEVEEALLGIDPARAKVYIDKVTKSLAGYADQPTLRLADAQAIKNSVSRKFNVSSMTDANEARGAILRGLRVEMEDAIERNLPGDLKSKFVDAKRRYGNLAEATEFYEASAAEFRADAIKFGEDVVGFKEKLGVLGSMTGATVFKNPAAATKAASTLMRMSARKSPVANRQVASLLRVADKIDAAPGRYSNHVQAVMAAAGRTTDEFVDELAVLEGTINLDEAPVKRTTEDILARATDVLPLVKKFHPGVHGALQAALSEQNTAQVSEIMSNLGRVKPQWMEPGIGIDGKAVTETDRIEARQFIDSTDWGTTQKMVAIDNLNLGGALPDWNEPPTSPIAPVRKAKERTKGGRKKADF